MQQQQQTQSKLTPSKIHTICLNTAFVHWNHIHTHSIISVKFIILLCRLTWIVYVSMCVMCSDATEKRSIRIFYPDLPVNWMVRVLFIWHEILNVYIVTLSRFLAYLRGRHWTWFTSSCTHTHTHTPDHTQHNTIAIRSIFVVILSSYLTAR